MLIMRRRFETMILNADPKRRERKYCSCFPRLEDNTFTWKRRLYRTVSECLIQAIVRAQVNRYRCVIWRHLNVVIMWFCVHASTWIRRFALATFVNAHLWAFWNKRIETRLFENEHGCNSVLLYPRLPRWIWPQEFKHKRTPFWIGVLKRILFVQ